MNLDLKSYFKIYPNWLGIDVCNSVVDALKTVTSWEKHSFNTTEGRIISFDSDFETSYAQLEFSSLINDQIWKALEQYVFKDLGFSWFNGWSGFTNVKYNKYEVGTEMRLHCDHIKSVFDGDRKGIPILTVLGVLNDDYEGGKLVMWENEVIELKAGDIVIFPSNFLYPHKITPVTQGTRYSYVSMVW